MSSENFKEQLLERAIRVGSQFTPALNAKDFEKEFSDEEGKKGFFTRLTEYAWQAGIRDIEALDEWLTALHLYFRETLKVSSPEELEARAQADPKIAQAVVDSIFVYALLHAPRAGSHDN